MTSNDKEKSNIEKNIELFRKKNENMKKKVDEILDEISSKLSLEYSLGNMQNILSNYHSFLTCFIESLKNLINEIQSNFGNSDQHTFFHKIFYTILLKNQELFQKISSDLLEIRVTIAKKIEQSSIKYDEFLMMYNKIKIDFGEKYNENFNNFKNYIKVYNEIEKFYENENIFDWEITEENNINTYYEKYLKTNKELNNYSNTILPASIEILNEHKKHKNLSSKFLNYTTIQLIKIFSFVTKNTPLFLYTKEEIKKEEIEIKETYDFTDIQFPIIKYNFETLNKIKEEENDNSLNINLLKTENNLKILERIIEKYPFIKNDIIIEQERKKFKVREFLTKLIEKSEIDNKSINTINDYLKEEFYRTYFLKYINKKRTKGNLQIKNNEAFKNFGLMMKEIMEFIDIDKNINNTKLIFIMSQTYFYVNKNNKKIYLINFIKDNKLLKKTDFWIDYLNQNISLDFDKIKENNNVIENSFKENVSFSKIMSVIQNMNECQISKDIIKELITYSFQKYNLSKELCEQINLVYDNITDKEIKEFNIDKEII